jgi:predicted nucleic acid-binding protein
VHATDPHHDECVELLSGHPGPLLVPALVVAEAAYLIADRVGPRAEILFLGDVASGNLIVEPVHAADWERMIELIWRYRDLGLGSTDASVIAAAERLGISEVATLDHRHFSVVRPDHVETLTLLP